MKKLLTIFAVLFALAGAGQTDSLTLKNDTTLYYPVGGGGWVVTQAHEPKYDTVAIVYLYADTATNRVTDSLSWIDYNVKWDFGYEVREVKAWYYHFHIGYLDRQKNPVRKGIVIWQVKQIQ